MKAYATTKCTSVEKAVGEENDATTVVDGLT